MLNLAFFFRNRALRAWQLLLAAPNLPDFSTGQISAFRSIEGMDQKQ